MPSALRPRRPQISSLPCYNQYDARWCPDSAPLDDSSSSSSYSDFEDDETLTIQITDDDYQPLCKVRNSRQKLLSQRTLMVRTVMVIFAVIAVALNFRFENNYSSETTMAENVRQVHRSSPSNHSPKRRLTETTPSKLQNNRIANIKEEAKLRRNAIELLVNKFGKGPHFVEFELKLWEGDVSTTLYFTIEMAPAHVMPASVHLFLQQVSNGLWSGTSFYLNADHIFAARPVSGNGKITKHELFDQSGFGKLSFLEYNSAYPHLPYTLGFAGRGPEFYINKSHNTHHDPCFANVVIGRSTIQKIVTIRGNDRNPARIRPIDIVSARIVHPDNLNPIARAEYMATTLKRQ
jgi:hypothetical protein